MSMKIGVSERMLTLRIFLQHWQSSLDAALIKRLGPVCRETAQFCRTFENQYYLGRFEQHMLTFAPTFWRVAREYFEGDEELHFEYNEQMPLCDVHIYTGCSIDDLDFIDEFSCDYDTDDTVITSYDIPGLTKNIYISWDCKRRGAMFHRDSGISAPKIVAETEDEYNHALDMLSIYRDSILNVDVSDLKSFTVRAPYYRLKYMLYRTKTIADMREMRKLFESDKLAIVDSSDSDSFESSDEFY